MRRGMGWALAALAVALLGGAVAARAEGDKPWYKQPWDPARVKLCDRPCLVGFIDGYLHALESKDRGALALAEEVWFTENTARLELGEGILWHGEIKPTAFKITAADPVTGEVAVQTVYMIEGKPALVAVRLKVERRMITEIEHLLDRNVAPEAMELLQKPRPTLVDDLPVKERSSRELMLYAANAYFDALTGEDGKIAPFAEDCVRHEQGYQTVHNKTPGRAAPTPKLPDPSTPMGKLFSDMSMMTCAQLVDTKIFAGIHRIWPRRALIIDEQKGLVATFPLFIHDGTRRKTGTPMDDRPGLAMVLNMVTMETFAIRDGKIWEVEAFPFVTFPYGLGDGWTPAKAR